MEEGGGKTFLFLISLPRLEKSFPSPFPVFSFSSFFSRFRAEFLPLPSPPAGLLWEEEEGEEGGYFLPLSPRRVPPSSSSSSLPPFIFFEDSSQKAGLCFPPGYSTPLLLPPPLHSHGKKERSCLCHDFPPSTLLFCANLVVDD